MTMTTGGFRAYLERLASSCAMSPEQEAEYERQQEAERREAEQRALERRLACLSPRHLRYARILERGGRQDSHAWKALSQALSKAPSRPVLLCGPTGTGKTTAVTRWALRRAQGGNTVLHCPAAKWPGLAKHEEALEEAQLVDCLILDQLHRIEGLPDWITTPIRELIDHRYERGRQTIAAFTGDTTADAVAAAARALKPEIVERLGGTLAVQGESYRRVW